MSNYSKIYEIIKVQSDQYYTDNFDFSDPLSNNHALFESAIESMDDYITYHNSDLLSADVNSVLFKRHNADKLRSWLKDQSVSHLFEHDLIVDRATQYYSDQHSFMTFWCDEYEQYLHGELSFVTLTDDERNTIESELNCFIPTDSKQQFYFHGSGFEFILPISAILREYKECNS